MSSSALLIGFVVVSAIAWYLLPYLIRQLEVRRWRRLCAKHRLLVLTFDDGPGEHLTHDVVSLLKELNAKATFFFVGNRAILRPETVKEVSRGGFDIGSHTSRHLNAWKSLPFADCRDMVQGQCQVTSLVGETRLFRPPYGKMTFASYILARLKGFDIAWWTVDPQDSLQNPKPHSQVLEEIKRSQGGIVLLHDFDTFPDSKHEDYVLSLVKKIHTLALELGLRFVTFTEFRSFTKQRSPTHKQPLPEKS